MPNVFATNKTSSSLTVSSWTVYYIDSTDAEIVEVQDGNNVKYNAFKYLLSGTPYWYVIDGEHDTWTDDLSEWGYSEVPVGPVLPEVILMAYSGNEWNYPASFNTNPLTFVSGEQAQLYIASGTSFSYESDKVYSVGEYQNPSGTTTGRYGFSVVSVNSKIGCKNISGGSITIQRMSVYRCSNSTATVVPVYSSSNVAYNAFKFTASGTDYYYVLDGVQTAWVDDLSSIGYHIPLPTVETSGFDRWITATSNNTSYAFSPNESTFGYVNSQIMPYDATMSYAVVEWRDDYNYFAGRVEFQIGNDNGSTTITNVSTSTLTFFQARIARCLSNGATVVTVYNSSNVAYNSFKFTENGTDYYYVLDGTQTDWTDDLSSIGYHFTISYLAVNKSRMTVGVGESYSLYNESGVRLEYDSTKTYTAVKYYTSSGDLVGVSALGITIGYVSGWSYLMLTNNTGAEIEIQRIEYIIS